MSPRKRTESVVSKAADADAAYWLVLFSPSTWQEFVKDGGRTCGFRETKERAVSRIAAGDTLLCYVTKVSKFAGALKVNSAPYRDTRPIWSTETFPWRIDVIASAILPLERAVSIKELRHDLAVLQRLKDPTQWSGPFRNAPVKWSREDGSRVVQAVSAVPTRGKSALS